MDLDRVTGSANRIAGQVQEAVGELAGEAMRQTEGAARRATAAAHDAYGQVHDQARDAAAVVSGSVQRQPLAALLIAGAVGGLITLMLARR